MPAKVWKEKTTAKSITLLECIQEVVSSARTQTAPYLEKIR